MLPISCLNRTHAKGGPVPCAKGPEHLPQHIHRVSFALKLGPISMSAALTRCDAGASAAGELVCAYGQRRHRQPRLKTAIACVAAGTDQREIHTVPWRVGKAGSGKTGGRGEGKGQHAPDFTKTGNMFIGAGKIDPREKAGRKNKPGGNAGERSRFRSGGCGAVTLLSFRLPEGKRNGKGGKSSKNAGGHERRRYELQGSGRSVPSTGQQEDRNDPHAYSAEKAEPTNGVHGRALFVSGAFQR